jgi:LmbE family N-acetylglucosaminyl deacetylase
LESDLIPHTASPVLAAKAVLILAPHPDDEVFGCAGAIMGHVAGGVPVHVSILTNGAAGGDPVTRAGESNAAAQLLGYGEPECWGLPDRGLRYTEVLVQRIITRIQATGVDLVYAPSPWEVHPDHRQASMLAVEAVRRLGYPLRLAFYEVGAPLAPNFLLDISAMAPIKAQAMRCFVSQQAQQDYARHIDALNQYRSYTLVRSVQAAEAFYVLSAAELNQAHRLGSLPIMSRPLDQPEAAHIDQPLVSILIRSIDRDYLAQALDSVALQSYPNIEVIVVAARPGHGPLPAQIGGAPVELVQTAQPLGRSQAANKALSLARGRYLMMLDDDDWLMPDHVAKLALVLQGQPNALAAYSGVSLVSEAGQPMGQVFDLPFDAVRLSAGNLTPIHAVLFKADVRGLGCRFDESLHHYEDWDFWLQLSKLAPMAHVPGVSAAYRIHDSSGVHADPGPAGEATQQVYQKWQNLWEPAQLQGIMRRVWSHQELEVQHATLRGELDELRRALAQSVLSNQQLSASYERQLQQLDQQRHAMQALSDTIAAQADTAWQQDANIRSLNDLIAQHQHTIADMLASRSWRVTRPLRWLTDVVRRRVWSHR